MKKCLWVSSAAVVLNLFYKILFPFIVFFFFFFFFWGGGGGGERVLRTVIQSMSRGKRKRRKNRLKKLGKNNISTIGGKRACMRRKFVKHIYLLLSLLNCQLSSFRNTNRLSI